MTEATETAWMSAMRNENPIAPTSRRFSAGVQNVR